MNRMFARSLTLAGSALAVVLTFAQIMEGDDSGLCVNFDVTGFNSSLPASHPANRCASGQQADVSWFTWFSGRSKSYQFHYLDLLELLSRSSDDSDSASVIAP